MKQFSCYFENKLVNLNGGLVGKESGNNPSSVDHGKGHSCFYRLWIAGQQIDNINSQKKTNMNRYTTVFTAMDYTL